MKTTVTQIWLKSFPKYDSLSFNEPDLRPPHAQSILGTANYRKRQYAARLVCSVQILRTNVMQPRVFVYITKSRLALGRCPVLISDEPLADLTYFCVVILTITRQMTGQCLQRAQHRFLQISNYHPRPFSKNVFYFHLPEGKTRWELNTNPLQTSLISFTIFLPTPFRSFYLSPICTCACRGIWWFMLSDSNYAYIVWVFTYPQSKANLSGH